jgi:ADP-ribose pyrophosphatase
MELAATYHYCPACGSPRKSFTPLRPFRCNECGHSTFFGPVSAVGAIVRNGLGHVLLLRRANEPGKGMLGMPGGFVDPGENAEEALKREVLEEVGLHVTKLTYLISRPNEYLYRGIHLPVLDFFYIAEVATGEITNSDGEITSWVWTDLSDPVLDQLAFESNRQALRYYRDHYE